ncbi:hypothetical protein SLS58_002052 [Diplodia intermedia]|uniref:Uncharacterized protein n=1 Tax=Diplodia intermedia TaxID=856260 RepID=A0ABR3U1D4_9PEZI
MQLKTASYVPYARFHQRDLQILTLNSKPVKSNSTPMRSTTEPSSSASPPHATGLAHIQSSELNSVLMSGYQAQRKRRIPNALQPGRQGSPSTEVSSDTMPPAPSDYDLIPAPLRITRAKLEGTIKPIIDTQVQSGSDSPTEDSRSTASSTAVSPSPSTPPSTSTTDKFPSPTTHPTPTAPLAPSIPPSPSDNAPRPTSDSVLPPGTSPLLSRKPGQPRLRKHARSRSWNPEGGVQAARLSAPLPPTPYDMAIDVGLLGAEDHHRGGRAIRDSNGGDITIPRRPLGDRAFRPAAARASGAWGPDDVGAGDTGFGGDQADFAQAVKTPVQWLKGFTPKTFDEMGVQQRGETRVMQKVARKVGRALRRNA